VAAALVLGYVLGCLNTGYYLVRIRTGLDLRRQGSGTAGATNAGRLLGRYGFLLAMLGDVAKGVAAVALARALSGDDGVAGLAAFGVVTGHVYPVQLGFRGGKGLATLFGAGMALAPAVGAVAVGVAALVLAATRRKVLSALTGVAVAPAAAMALGAPGSVAAVFLAAAVVVLIRHARPPTVSSAPPAGPASHGAA
jgi:acyl phosphate:glycerol-3-phosphate acyltransferase